MIFYVLNLIIYIIKELNYIDDDLIISVLSNIVFCISFLLMPFSNTIDYIFLKTVIVKLLIIVSWLLAYCVFFLNTWLL